MPPSWLRHLRCANFPQKSRQLWYPNGGRSFVLKDQQYRGRVPFPYLCSGSTSRRSPRLTVTVMRVCARCVNVRTRSSSDGPTERNWSVALTDRCWLHCSDEGVGLLGVVSPGGGERLNVAVVAGESVDSALNANKTELGVSILSELLKMLSDGNGLLDEHVQVFGDLGGKTSLFEDSEDLGAGDSLNLGDTVRVSKSDADLGWG